MKFTTRGFTLVELMIVIAIIGILAAALFPALTGYLARGRDTARISHVGQLINATSSYYQDNSSYSGIALPTTPRCVNTGSLAKYMGGKTPTDASIYTHCNVTNGNYGVGTGNINSFTPAVAITAVMENKGNGNTGGTMVSLSTYQGDISLNMATLGSLSKGYGTGYVVYR